MARKQDDEEPKTRFFGSVYTSVRLTTVGNELWEELADSMGVSKTGVLEILVREKARALGILPPPRVRVDLLESRAFRQQAPTPVDPASGPESMKPD